MRGQKEQTIKSVFILLILLVLDITKPFYYFIYTEFIFLGIIITALNSNLFLSFTLSIIFGYLKDTLNGQGIPLNLIEFSLLTIIIHSVLFRFNKPAAKIIIVLIALAAHIALHTANAGVASPLFILCFFIQSSLVYLLLNHLLRKWIKHSSVEYI